MSEWQRQPGEPLMDWARRTMTLSGPEWDMLRHAQMANDLADDPKQPPMVCLAAAARFQAIARQLKFPED
jgi:hypothetical protein